MTNLVATEAAVGGGTSSLRNRPRTPQRLLQMLTLLERTAVRPYRTVSPGEAVTQGLRKQTTDSSV